MSSSPATGSAEDVARMFHESYERLAPLFGYATRRDSAVPWDQVPEPNRSLMIAVAGNVLWYLRLWAPSPATTPVPDEGWRCMAERSHGICRTLNDAEDAFCGACGADHPTSLPVALAPLVAAARRLTAAIDAANASTEIRPGPLFQEHLAAEAAFQQALRPGATVVTLAQWLATARVSPRTVP
jgi:hypothetical protein